FPLYYIKEEQSIPLLHKILEEFGFSPTEVGEELTSLPADFSLELNYPNPFNPSTTIPFSLKVQGSKFNGPIHTTLKIYNILGQLVKTLVDEEKTPGRYTIIWDGKDNSGKEVASGIYFYQLRTKDYNTTRKMVLLR
ncbi:MAG: FlgD immunoglobulin-like domain containing protein, partial [Candidatus Zixiibacteriota bacterium]